MRMLVLSLLAGALLSAQTKPAFLTGSGWRALLNGKDLQGWHAKEKGQPHEWFTTTAVQLDPANPKLWKTEPAPGPIIVNGRGGKTQDWVTDETHGDLELYLEWNVAQGSNSGVYLHGLYEVQILDSFGKPEPKYSDAGGIYHRWINEQGVGGSSPKVNAAKPAGEWQSFRIWFQAPRFDSAGKKTANAKFLKVEHNGQIVQENFEVDGGTRAHLPIEEAARNPLMLQGDHGPVAFRNIWWRPLRRP
jgi:hypothetical protein